MAAVARRARTAGCLRGGTHTDLRTLQTGREAGREARLEESSCLPDLGSQLNMCTRWPQQAAGLAAAGALTGEEVVSQHRLKVLVQALLQQVSQEGPAQGGADAHAHRQMSLSDCRTLTRRSSTNSTLHVRQGDEPGQTATGVSAMCRRRPACEMADAGQPQRCASARLTCWSAQRCAWAAV